MSIQLGPFALQDRVARGGMGSVWRAKHETGMTVAVKALHPREAVRAEMRDLFRAEVRAVAGLHHDHIIVVFDYGVIGDEAEAASDGALPAGSPYLVMEYADGGTLRPLAGRIPWAHQREILLSLLDALAHAHARGVVHRDLKPSNVVLAGRRKRAKLTDFGLAHLFTESDEAPLHAGTVAFMPPEQMLSQWRDFGPWTDLYALGAVAASLACGHAPLAGLGLEQAFCLAATEALPPLRPAMPVPLGFVEWAMRLMRADPAQRFQCAADAAWDLLQLGEPDPETVTQDAHYAAEAPTQLHLARATGPTLLQGFAEVAALPFADAARPDLGGLPPQPANWRSDAATPSLRLVGAGLGVWGLRQVPLVGREPERDAIWTHLRSVRANKEARVLVIRGPSGCGKTHLIDWMAARAHEVGAAGVLRAHHAAETGPTHGLEAMLLRHHGATGLDREGIAERIHSFLDALGESDKWEVDALVELLRPRPEDVQGVRFTKSAEKHVVLARHLERLTRSTGRPLVVVIDDAQWAPDALEFATSLLTSDRGGFPALFLCAVQDEALHEWPQTREAIQRLLEHPGAAELELQRMEHKATETLVQQLLGLDGELSRKVTEKVEGNPLFAVQLIGEWVERDLLVPGPKGFSLRAGARVSIPEGLEQVWQRRLSRALEGHGEATHRAVRLAATLGPDVALEEWRAVCEGAGLNATIEALDQLVRARLGRREADTFSFAHPLLRQTALADGGLGEEDHRCCARALRALGGRSGRVARHLLAAGDDADAIEVLQRAAETAVLHGNGGQAQQTLGQLTEALDRLEAGPDDVRRLRGDAVMVEVWRARADYASALAMAEGLARRAEAVGHRRTVARARASLGHITRQQGDLETSKAHMEQAIAEYVYLRDAKGILDCRVALGIVHWRTGEVDRAEQALRHALRVAERVKSLWGMGRALGELGNVAAKRGDRSLARTNYERALIKAELASSPDLIAYIENSIGSIAMLEGDPKEARRRWKRSEEVYTRIGSPQCTIPMINIATIDVANGDFGAGRERLLAGLRRFEELDWQIYVGSTHIELLICAAHFQDWDEWDAHLDAGATLLGARGVVDEEIAANAERAGKMALERNERGRARAAFSFAALQWRGVGHEDRATSAMTAAAGAR